MALDTSEGWYVSFTATPPFGVALLKRRMNGVIAVGAVFENDWALKPILEQIKPIVKRTPGLESNELYGLHEDTEDANALWRMAHDVIPIRLESRVCANRRGTAVVGEYFVHARTSNIQVSNRC